MKQWSQDQIMKGLRELVTEIEYLEKIDDVDGKSGGICTTTEDACIFKDIPPFNYDLEYGEMLVSEATRIIPNHKGMKVKEMYIYGIHREIYSWLEERGWYPEWHDRVHCCSGNVLKTLMMRLLRILKLIKSILILIK